MVDHSRLNTKTKTVVARPSTETEKEKDLRRITLYNRLGNLTDDQ